MRPMTAAPILACLLLAGCDYGSHRDEGGAPAAHPGGAVPIAAPPATAKRKKDAPPAAVAPPVDPAQPTVPALPDDIGLGSTDVELGAQALMVAQEEHDRGDLGSQSIADRHRYIYQVWLPQMNARQAYLQQLADERKHEADRQVAEAVRVAKHQDEIQQTEARLSRQVEAERRKTAPILSREDHDVLE